jgi:hypothetical protein
MPALQEQIPAGPGMDSMPALQEQIPGLCMDGRNAGLQEQIPACPWMPACEANFGLSRNDCATIHAIGMRLEGT